MTDKCPVSFHLLFVINWFYLCLFQKSAKFVCAKKIWLLISVLIWLVKWKISDIILSLKVIFLFRYIQFIDDSKNLIELAIQKIFLLIPLLYVYLFFYTRYIFAKSKAEATLQVNCSNVKYLEHVQARLTVSSNRRGDLHIILTSPMGTK